MTLTETAILTKKVLIFGGIFLAVCLIAWGGWSYYYNNIYVPPPAPKEIPNLNFGTLPKLDLPTSDVSSSNFSYSLDTESGDLPEDLPELMKVYSIASLATDLLALDRAKNLSFVLGFNKVPEMLTSTNYRFSDDKGGELIVNLDNGNFKFRRLIASDSAELEVVESFINENRQSQNFKSFLSAKNLLKDQLEKGRTQVSYNNAVRKEASQAAILLWQEDIQQGTEKDPINYPLVTPTFKDSLIRTIISNYRDEIRKYITLDYTFWPIDYENTATYPIKNIADAYEDMQGDGGTVIVEPNTSKASITKVYLAYLLSEEYAPYLQPIYVFEGPDFVGYVPAILDEHTEK